MVLVILQAGSKICLSHPTNKLSSESLGIREVNHHAARTYSSMDSTVGFCEKMAGNANREKIDKRTTNPGNAKNPVSNIEIAPRKLFRRVRPGDLVWDLLLGGVHSMFNEAGAKWVDKTWFAPQVAAVPGAPADPAPPYIVPTREHGSEPGSEQQDNGHPASFPSSEAPPSISMFTSDENGPYNCNGNDCTQTVSFHRKPPLARLKSNPHTHVFFLVENLLICIWTTGR